MSVRLLQLLAGHEAVCKSVLNTMDSFHEEEESEALLLMDALNAFNSV